MKKLAIIGILLIVGLSSVNAQGLYFDVGIGVGRAWTRVDGENIASSYRSAGINLTQFGVDLGLKAGYGPIANMPLYVVGAFSAMAHRMFDRDDDYIQFNSFVIGPGVIYYPIPLIQLAGSVGYAFSRNSTSLSFMEMYRSTRGFGWDISAAVDLGPRNHGVLLGLRYAMAITTLEVSRATQNQSGLTVFARYAFRHRMSQ